MLSITKFQEGPPASLLRTCHQAIGSNKGMALYAAANSAGVVFFAYEAAHHLLRGDSSGAIAAGIYSVIPVAATALSASTIILDYKQQRLYDRITHIKNSLVFNQQNKFN